MFDGYKETLFTLGNLIVFTVRPSMFANSPVDNFWWKMKDNPSEYGPFMSIRQAVDDHASYVLGDRMKQDDPKVIYIDFVNKRRL